LFKSLASEYAHRAVGVVLSGSDADGAQGVEEIKAAGGITMAQEPDSAKFAGMPKSAIATGCVDFVLPPIELAAQLSRIARHPYLSSGVGTAQEQDRLRGIFRLLLSQNGTDFSRYKRSTVQRRLARRIALRQVEGLDQYIDLLRRDPNEVQALAQDFLVRVTGFFRDPEGYEGLANIVLPALFENRAADPVRIWVPGCASGEEVYSIAIVLLEYLGERASAHRIQIFATDLSDIAIEKARNGVYSDAIADELSAERLNRFFTKINEHYQISKIIRDLCIFARQDVTKDPPFSRLDLVSCRNVLIYLDQGMQRQILSLFHYSLKPNGFLILGASETVGRSSELFRQVEGHPQIYRRQPVQTKAVPAPSLEEPEKPRPVQSSSALIAEPAENERAQREIERLLLGRYAPAAILVDAELNAVYFQGDTSRYLQHGHGAASFNLQKIVRPGLLVELAPAIREAHETGKSAVREGIRVESDSREQEVSFEVVPVSLPGSEAHYSLILFGKPSLAPIAAKPRGSLVKLWESLFWSGSAAVIEKDSQIAALRRELEATRDYLQATVEEHEAAKEEMRAAHEEALSVNEEFLSTNEELETAKEELQSANEELGVTNQELSTRNTQLSVINEELRGSRAFLDAIVETIREPLLVLDRDLVVTKANAAFFEIFKVQPEHTLRLHLYDLGEGQWDIPELRKLLGEVIPEKSVVKDYEVSHTFPEIGQRTMLLNARRLISTDGDDEMILLAIEDITYRHIAEQKLQEADHRKNNFLATLAHELRNPLAPIRLRVELLRRQTNGTDLKQLDMIERQIAKLTGIVDDLLDIARIERDQFKLRKEPLDLVSLVQDTIDASSYLFDERHHRLSLFLSKEPIPVIGDPIRLEQVVSNLLSNAAKYTDPEGEIEVSVARIGSSATIKVRDNGVGISPDMMPQLFEMFFQARTSLDRAEGGLGIGLSITKRLVELHGGRVEAFSDGPGKGSEFLVHLPISQVQDHPAPLKQSPSPASSSRTRRILIVDDNVDTAEAVAELARALGHTVVVAHDGATALEIARTFRSEIALLDIGLPRMNGYELARRLRQLDGMEATLLVAMSGYGREEDRQESQRAGFNYHLIKPVDAARLERLLSTMEDVDPLA
jgi:two-component system, chemotaxis family, CheB/CheR fusion protein